MSLEIRFTSTDFEHVLFCPYCNSNYLHQGKVEVFERQEDAKEGTHVIIDNDDVTINRNLSGNPSRRRHGLKIGFWCENCKEHPVMSIYQHKGQTMLEFK
ncbi:hypothetical protein SPG90_04555 [Enterobacter sp. D2]|uniref:hypothetical protein n=1 Tax=Enterobacter TaxID=547 RepID=UPI002ACA09C8|nr:hypothetical protein [Enterobacter sp. D2]MDZ5727787.1 hypothetical protein [Enterobacter sp. D2]